MAWLHGTAAPKGEKRSTTKRRKLRLDSAEQKSVRAKCVERDGYCRLATTNTDRVLFHAPHICYGDSELAHLEQFKRARTRGMAPEERHTTQGAAMLCHAAHFDYDTGAIMLRFMTDALADGPIEWRRV